MNNLVDHNGRTIWFTGPPGPMKPSNAKTRGKRVVGKKAKAEPQDDHDYSPKKAKSRIPKSKKKTEDVVIKKEDPEEDVKATKQKRKTAKSAKKTETQENTQRRATKRTTRASSKD